MALFKILRGPSSELRKLPINDGFCYFTPDTGLFHIDYDGQRVPLNAKDAETLMGASLKHVLSENEGDLRIEIPSSYLLNQITSNLTDSINSKQDKVNGEEGQIIGFDKNGQLVAIDAVAGSEGLIDQNSGSLIKLWYGTVEEYEAIEAKDENTIYILSNEVGGDIVANDIEYDNSASGLLSTSVQNAIDEVYESISNIDHSAYSTATNLINGLSEGSLRTIGSTIDNDSPEIGEYSFTEGYNTIASGDYSHAEGIGTIAHGHNQHVQGSYNIGDLDLLHIVGNGEDGENRSNAHTLDWNGTAWFAGDVYVGSTSGTNKDEGSKKLATEEFVETEVAALVNSAPETLDTLGELATAFEENKEVVEALDASITNKQDKISDSLILVDTVTGKQHKIQIQNGQLVSFPVE